MAILNQLILLWTPSSASLGKSPGHRVWPILLRNRSLIDPGFMQKVPMLLAGGLPYILRPPSPDQAPSQVLQEDRKVFIAALESLQPRFPQVVSWMLRIHCAGDVDYRACFLESIMSKGMHARLAHMDWKLPGCKLPGQQNGLSFHCD